MADNMGVAVLLTFITTYLGFLSIALNDIQLLFQFGLVASTGLLFNFLITVVLVPVLLGFLGHRRVAVLLRRVQHPTQRGEVHVGGVAAAHHPHPAHPARVQRRPRPGCLRAAALHQQR